MNENEQTEAVVAVDKDARQGSKNEPWSRLTEPQYPQGKGRAGDLIDQPKEGYLINEMAYRRDNIAGPKKSVAPVQQRAKDAN